MLIWKIIVLLEDAKEVKYRHIFTRTHLRASCCWLERFELEKLLLCALLEKQQLLIVKQEQKVEREKGLKIYRFDQKTFFLFA